MWHCEPTIRLVALYVPPTRHAARSALVTVSSDITSQRPARPPNPPMQTPLGKSCRTFGMNEPPDGLPHSGPIRIFATPPTTAPAQTCAAPAQGRDDPTAIGPRVGTGTAPRTTGLSTAALRLNGDRYLSACGRTVPRANHRLRTDDDTAHGLEAVRTGSRPCDLTVSATLEKRALAMQLVNPYIPSGVEER